MKITTTVLAALVLSVSACAPLSTEPSTNTTASNNSNARPASSPATSSANSSTQILPYPEVPRITIADAKKAYDAGTAVLVDTHSKEMYDNEHITSAINVPFNEMDSYLDKVPKDKVMITYCSCPAENTSAAVADRAIAKGRKDVFALQGGTNAWKSAGYPIQKKAN